MVGIEQDVGISARAFDTMTTLDTVVEKKIKPMLDEAMRRYLGVRIEELTTDVSDRLRRSALLDIPVDVNVPFKKAKLAFKKNYLIRLLQLHFGNIAEVARLSGVDRRSVHRLVRQSQVGERARKELHRRDFYVSDEVSTIIQESAEHYKGSLAPEKYRAFYDQVPIMGKVIAKELPLELPTLEQAERAWERRYFEAALKEFGPSPVAVARKIGLRYETLHRKLKTHGIQ